MDLGGVLANPANTDGHSWGVGNGGTCRAPCLPTTSSLHSSASLRAAPCWAGAGRSAGQGQCWGRLQPQTATANHADQQSHPASAAALPAGLPAHWR
eukprot:scaffold6328_cov18-Tisochrysis_lutea.AAC.1